MKKFFSVRLHALAVSSILLAGVIFSSCDKSDDDIEAPVAGLMAFNLVPDMSSVGIELSGNSLGNAPLLYTSFTGGYLNVFPGNREITSYSPASDSTLASSTYNFEPRKFYSLFVVGANDNYFNVITNDNFDSLSSTSGKAYIRYINAVPDSSMSMVSVSANGTDVLNNNSGFAHISDFVAVNPGQVSIAIDNENSIQANRTISVEERKAYTVLLIGMPNATDTTRNIQIRFIENGTLD